MVHRKKTPRLPGEGPPLAHLENLLSEFEINKKVEPEGKAIIGYQRRNKNPETTTMKIRRDNFDNVIQQVDQQIVEEIGNQEHNQGGEEESPEEEEEEEEEEGDKDEENDNEEDEEEGGKDRKNKYEKSKEDSEEEEEEKEQG
ncbi:histone H3.v1-like [Papaver somniferum]|uniref:histone H3.v1-like n=1 Tax=Papaver somniferum TaxID=3469 RepID=UPI000E6FEC47|nr:histone H3.v1-like [Papaver somniferum]